MRASDRDVLMKLPSPLRLQTLNHHRRHNVVTKLLRACASVSELHGIHASMIKAGIDLLPFPSARLLSSAALLDLDHAFSLFRLLPSPSLFSFNCILRSLSLSLRPNLPETLSVFNSIRSLPLPLDQFSFIAVLKTCSRVPAVRSGQQLHCLAARAGFDLFLNLRNSLLHFYCTCGAILDAHKLFAELPLRRDEVSFSALMGGFLRASQPAEVISFLRGMLESSAQVGPSAIVIAFSAVAGCNISGEPLHCYCLKTGLGCDPKVATAAATVYAKAGTMDHAHQLFDEMPKKDVVLYNCVIDGHAKKGSLDRCLVLLQQMKGEGTRPNAATFVGLLALCASSGSLGIGRRIHELVENEKLEMEVSLGTALVDMYAKNGCLEEAVLVFRKVRNPDVKAWTAMIMGFAVHGRSEDALRLSDEMEESGLRPNEVTLLAVLSACCHGGLVNKGKEYFKRVVLEYRLCPGVKHYGCIVDLLGRAGQLQEAYELVRSLPFGGDAMAWRALLAASRVHGEARMGRLAFEALAAMGEEHPGDTVLLSGGYAFAGRWGEARQVMDVELVKEEGMSQEAGCSSIEMVGL